MFNIKISTRSTMKIPEMYRARDVALLKRFKFESYIINVIRVYEHSHNSAKLTINATIPLQIVWFTCICVT